MTNNSIKHKHFVKIISIIILLGLLGAAIIYGINQTNNEKTADENNDAENNERENEDKILKNKKTFTIPQNGHINAERDRLKVSFGPSFYYPTGLYVKTGDKIKITVNDHDQFIDPRLIVSPALLKSFQASIEDGFRIEKGTKEIEMFRDGILYFVNNNNKTNIKPEVIIEGANILPTFTLGETTVEEWEEIIEIHSDAPAFELVSDLVTITVGMDHVGLVTNPEELLIKHDEAVRIQARVSGLDENDPDPIHHPTKFPYHYRHSIEDGVWMYAWNNHTGYHTNALPYLIRTEEFVTDGWGPWHELGHVHQQGATTPGIFGEVTNNVFSMAVQRDFKQTSRLEDEGIYDRVFAYLDGTDHRYEELDVFDLLVSLWQLDLTYGQDVYPQLYRLVRETDPDELPTEDEDKIQQFVYWTSMIVGQNLIPFYEKWGLEIQEDTINKISSLEIPKLTAPIWWNRDTNNTIKALEVSIESLSATLEAYKNELTDKQFEKIKTDLTNLQEGTNDEESEQVIENLLNYIDSELITEDNSDRIREILYSQVDLFKHSTE